MFSAPVGIEANFASEFYRILTKQIMDFEASLDKAHEVGLCTVSEGGEATFGALDTGIRRCWFYSLCRVRHKAYYADLRIMQRWSPRSERSP